MDIVLNTYVGSILSSYIVHLYSFGMTFIKYNANIMELEENIVLMLRNILPIRFYPFLKESFYRNTRKYFFICCTENALLY